MILALLQKLVAGYQSSDEVVDWVFSEQIRQNNGIDDPDNLSSGSSPHQMD